nr:MAG TPA: hypothetical protein [Caudoviricetes sp.]
MKISICSRTLTFNTLGFPIFNKGNRLSHNLKYI